MAVLACALLTIASCGPPSATLTESDQAQIYAAVIARLRDDQQARMPAYIMEYTDDSGGTESEKQDPQTLSESLQKSVLSALAGAPDDYTWVSDFSQVPHDAIFSGAACQVILGNVHLQEDGSVQVVGSLFYGGTGGGGGTFVLKRDNGVWTVTGMTGPVWMS